MEYSPSKKRKISPNAGVQVNTLDLQARGHGSRGSHTRPSFMSPTKASLARFNPSLLLRSGSPKSRRLVNGQSEDAVRTAQAGDRGQGLNGMYSRAAPSSTIVETRKDVAPYKGSDHASDLEDTPSKLPRSIAPRGSTDAVNASDKLQTPTHKIQQQKATGEGYEKGPEPSLPSTPSQLGLEAPPEKPKGLLFQSPDRRGARHDRRAAQRSPLKARDLPARTTVPQDRIAALLGPRRDVDVSKTPKGEPVSTYQNTSRDLERLRCRLEIVQDELTKLSFALTTEVKGGLSLRRHTRLKKQVAKDARAILQMHRKGHCISEHEASNTGTITNSATSTVGRQSTYAKLTHSLPFKPKSRSSMADPSSISRDDAVESGIEQTDFLVRTTTSSLFAYPPGAFSVRQHVTILTPEKEMISSMQLLVEPMLQKVANESLYQLAPWVAKELRPWLADVGQPRNLRTLGETIRKYVRLASLRDLCWSHCTESLSTLTVGSSACSFEIMGRGSEYLRIKRGDIKMTVKWQIVVNDDATIHSEIKLDTDVSRAWLALDSNSDLDKISDGFDTLVKERGVAEAVQTIAKVLYPP